LRKRCELLDRVLATDPTFFEKLIVSLLTTMGYGGSRGDAGRAIGKLGDGGLDGVIDEDPLGLDRVYIQAKRYRADSAVAEPEIRGFAGSLESVKATKGVFVIRMRLLFERDTSEKIEFRADRIQRES